MRLRPLLALLPAAALAACSAGSSGPVASGSGAPAGVALVATKAGCAPAPATLPAGAMTFTIRNDDAPAVSEVELMKGTKILGEKENLIPGKTASFSLRLTAGTYTVYCPGAGTDKSPFVVTAS